MKIYNITFDDGTPLMKSATIESENIIKALEEFGEVGKVVGVVGINPLPKAKAVTILANSSNMTLLKGGRVEVIKLITDTHVETEENKYNLECVKMI